MRIVKLTAENLKKLRAVEITPTGDVVQITGRNGQGKTSVLDAIWWALAGTKHIQAAPIRKGQNKARIRLDLGELIVERRFTDKGSALTVESAKGARYTSPQGILDALLGALALDPLEFVGLEPRRQFETLRGIVKLELDVDQLDALNRGDFDRRTEINREARSLRAQADGIAVPDELPVGPLNTAARLQRLTDAAKINSEIEAQRLQRGRTQEAIVGIREEAGASRTRAQELRAEADRLEQEARVAEAQADRQEAELLNLPALPTLVDAEALRAELEQAQAANRLIEQRTRKEQLAGQAQALEDQARELTETMTAREQGKAAAIAKADMPVAGLGLGDGMVTFQGIPFDQASTAEQLRTSVAIAMAANPKLRVIRIKEGSMLDSDGLQLIADMAKAGDYQVWLERVDSTGKMGFFIEDGQVVAVDGEPVTEQPQPEPEAKTETKAAAAPAKPRPSSPW